ncbi:zinc-ribbon domain-containing protein [Vreelandella lionensis]|uniref:zinc-ribbon domain-containing protein n=1 Tax=Vreelandella lionensis TaxID=1144478 RepID=UPI001FB31960|nr:zinc-ribbon domain-containing protein [Halomonas lionensis]
MQTFSCRCGNPLFFENTHCLACESDVGWCPTCSNIVALEPLDNGGYRCTHEGCGTALMQCHNYWRKTCVTAWWSWLKVMQTHSATAAATTM